MGNALSTSLILNGVLDCGFLVPAIRRRATGAWFRSLREADGRARRVHDAFLGWCFAFHGIARLSAGIEPENASLRRIAVFSYFFEMASFGSQVMNGNLELRAVAPTIVIPAAMLLLLLGR